MTDEHNGIAIDPLTMDTWNMPIMGLQYHLWPAGSPKAVCGFQWGHFWDGGVTVPEMSKRCPQCDAGRIDAADIAATEVK